MPRNAKEDLLYIKSFISWEPISEYHSPLWKVMIASALLNFPGPPSRFRAASNPALSAWIAREAEHQRCAQGDCRVLRKRRGWKVDHCRCAYMGNSILCMRKNSERRFKKWISPFLSQEAVTGVGFWIQISLVLLFPLSWISRASLVYLRVNLTMWPVREIFTNEKLFQHRRPTDTPFELWRQVHVDGISRGRSSTCGMERPHGDESPSTTPAWSWLGRTWHPGIGFAAWNWWYATNNHATNQTWW